MNMIYNKGKLKPFGIMNKQPRKTKVRITRAISKKLLPSEMVQVQPSLIYTNVGYIKGNKQRHVYFSLLSPVHLLIQNKDKLIYEQKLMETYYR